MVFKLVLSTAGSVLALQETALLQTEGCVWVVMGREKRRRAGGGGGWGEKHHFQNDSHTSSIKTATGPSLREKERHANLLTGNEGAVGVGHHY